jgi:hypothetical protein
VERLLPCPLTSRNRLRGGKNKGQELHLLEDYGRKLKAKKMHALTIIQRKCPEVTVVFSGCAADALAEDFPPASESRFLTGALDHVRLQWLALPMLIIYVFACP